MSEKDKDGVIRTEILPFEALNEKGVLWLINRTVFHPRGFALALDFTEDGKAEGWQLWGNGDEPWGFALSEGEEEKKFNAVNELLESVKEKESVA